MARHTGELIGKEVCKVLGINSDNVARIDILLRAGSAAKVEIERYIETEEVGKVKKILEEYELKEKR